MRDLRYDGRVLWPRNKRLFILCWKALARQAAWPRGKISKMNKDLHDFVQLNDVEFLVEAVLFPRKQYFVNLIVLPVCIVLQTRMLRLWGHVL